MAYTTVQLYCHLGDRSCSQTSPNGNFTIYTDSDNVNKITIGYCSGGYSSDDGSCSNDETTYILNQGAIGDADNDTSGTKYGWATQSSGQAVYSSYVTLYNNIGNLLKEECDNIVTYGKLYVNWYNSSANCSFTEGSGTELTNLQSVISSIQSLTSAMSSNASYIPISTIADYIASAGSNVYEAINNVSDYTNNYSNIASNTSTIFSSAFNIFYYDEDLDEEEVTDTGIRNIYYFITEFINGLDSSYIGSNYSLVNGNYTLPNDMKSAESSENDFYYNLSLAFMTDTSTYESNAISLETLNTALNKETSSTTDDNETTGSTAPFTTSLIESILNDTKDNVIGVLKDYGVIE